eukprot:13409444-Alexandrium_andersonii.AAC.1
MVGVFRRCKCRAVIRGCFTAHRQQGLDGAIHAVSCARLRLHGDLAERTAFQPNTLKMACHCTWSSKPAILPMCCGVTSPALKC